MIANARTAPEPSIALSPQKLMLLLGIYLPFQAFALYSSGVTGVGLVVLKSLPEVLLYITLALAVIFHGINHRRFKTSALDRLLLLMLLSGAISTILYEADWLASLNSMRGLFRFVAVYYIVYLLGMRLSRWDTLVNALCIIAVITAIASLFQYAMGTNYPQYLKVQDLIRIDVTSDMTVLYVDKDEKINAAQGFFEAPGVMGVFCVLVIAAVLPRLGQARFKERLWYLGVLSLVFLSAYFSYAKVSIILGLALVGLYLYYLGRISRRTIFISLVLSTVAMIVAFVYLSEDLARANAKKEDVTVLANLLNIFSQEYWTNFFTSSRGWVLLEVGGGVLQLFPLFGFSPDPMTAKNLVAVKSGGVLAKLVEYGPFEDVYWVAILTYFGIFGVVVMLYIMFFLFKAANALRIEAIRAHDMRMLSFSSAFMALVVVMFFYNFVERAFKVDVMSYYFWLMAGMVMRMRNRNI